MLKYKKRFIQSILFVVVSTVMVTMATANTKGELLRRTMADISLLNSQLSQRKADAAEIRIALSKRLKELKTEARKEIRAKKITTKNEALKHPRLLNDLILMAEIQAYMNRYKQKIGYYRVACDRLSYLYQQADDDLKIVNALSGMKIDALVSQANQLNKNYLHEAQTILIKPNLLVVEPPEKVWEKLDASW